MWPASSFARRARWRATTAQRAEHVPNRTSSRVIEESDESDFWLEFAVASGLLKPGVEQKLRVEANELIAIFTQSQKTARANLGRE